MFHDAGRLLRVAGILLLAFCVSLPVRAEFYVYFARDIDSLYSSGAHPHCNVSLDSLMAAWISTADYSLDICLYNLTSNKVMDSIIAAHERGVKVRFITDADHRDNWEVQQLENAGVPVLDDTAGSNSGYGYMHNKFVVIDFRDSSDVSDDWVLTGSYNTTDGTPHADNVIIIRSHELARAYTLEFEEMWGTSGDYPNPYAARFGSRKTDNTPHHFQIDGVDVELYFSPSDNAISRVCQAAVTADREIDFCIFAFTRQDLCDSMKSRWDDGVMVKGVFDSHDWLGQYSKSRDMTGDGVNPWDPPAPVYPDQAPGYLHHKYMVVDALTPGSDPILVTGCMNWSNRGNNYNDENTLIIHSHELANFYLQDFVARYLEAGGSYSLTCGDADGDGSLSPADAYWVLNYLGSGPSPSTCWSANTDGDSEVSPADAYLILRYLGGAAELNCAPCSAER